MGARAVTAQTAELLVTSSRSRLNMTIQRTRPQAGILVSTDITAGAADEGYESQQHAEGIVRTRTDR